MIAAILALGVMATVIIPQNVMYDKQQNWKYVYQKNLAAVHSNPIIEYTMRQ